MKKNKRIKRAAGADTPAEEQRSQESRADKERKARILQLQEALAVCPGDILARYALATLQEEVGQPDEALFNWRAVLASNPNSLQAREGVARCREQISRILSSDVWGKTRVFDAGRC